MEQKSKAELLALAAEYLDQGIPAWATHIAVQSFDQRIQPAAWHPRVERIIAEDPATVPDKGVATTFKRDYWTLFPVDEVKAALVTA